MVREAKGSLHKKEFTFDAQSNCESQETFYSIYTTK